MTPCVVALLLLRSYLSDLSANEPKPPIRPISDAESVLAVYREDHGLVSDGRCEIIFAAWPDGFIVWSADRHKGGAPYRVGHFDPKRFTSVLARFEKDGLFADESLNHGHIGLESQFVTVLIKSGKKQVKMCSLHDWLEEVDGVDDGKRVAPLNGRRRLDVLRKAHADHLFYLFVWSDTRSKLAYLIPDDSRASGGKPFQRSGKLSWQE